MAFAARYEQVIVWIVSFCPGPDKFAHVFAGLTLWIAAALVGRWPLRAWPPLLAVIAAEIANEIVDRCAHGSWMWHDTLTDALATWFWPVALMLMLRHVPRLGAATDR